MDKQEHQSQKSDITGPEQPDAEQTDAELTEAETQVFDQLVQANPVSLDESTTSSWDGADGLFAQITSRPAAFEPYVEPAPVLADDSSGRRWPMLAAVAAALVVLIAAVSVFLPGSSQPALAAVSSAADQTAEINSGRVISTFAASGGDGTEVENLSGTITAEFNGQDLAISADIDSAPDDVAASELGAINAAESRMVDGRVFLTPDGEEWIGIEAPEFLRSTLLQYTDLRSILGQVNELAEVSEIGSASVDGIDVTHYQSQVDLADESLAESGWIPGANGSSVATPIDIEAEGLVIIDLYVDNDGLMRRIKVTGEAKPQDPTIDASADFVITTDFVDLGTDITIEAPDPETVQTIDGLDLEGLAD